MGTCIITGCSDGIGRAVATRLSKTKYFDSYALVGRNSNAMDAVTKDMMNNSDILSVESYYVDLSFPDKIPQVVNDVSERFGKIDCLLNIAGYTDPKPLLGTSLDSFEYTYMVNVFSPFMLIRECTRKMKDLGGKIVNVASTAGVSSRPGWISYASSKAALISMSLTLADELSEYGIRVYCVSPGRCATKLRKRLAPDENQNSIMQPEEVAEVICNLVSPAEKCLDGQNIIIRKLI